MKFYLLSLMLLLSILTTKAQYRARYNELGVGADVAIPFGSYMSRVYHAGAGGTINLLVALGRKDNLSISGSYYSFITKKQGASDNIVTGMLGYRSFFDLKNQTFYIEPKFGSTFISPKRNGFTYSGGIGYIFGEGWDLSLRYQDVYTKKKDDKIAFIGLNLSYNFVL